AELVVARQDVGVEVIQKFSGGAAGRSLLIRMQAVEVAREAIVLRGRMHMVQRRGDRVCAEPDGRIRALMGDAAAGRVATAREEREARGWSCLARAHCSSCLRTPRWAAPDTPDGRPNWDSPWLSSHRGLVSR